MLLCSVSLLGLIVCLCFVWFDCLSLDSFAVRVGFVDVVWLLGGFVFVMVVLLIGLLFSCVIVVCFVVLVRFAVFVASWFEFC